MRIDDIVPGVAFIGYIPPNSDREHLGIVIITDELYVHYCYCTSKSRLTKYVKRYISISKDTMKRYFPNYRRAGYWHLFR